MQCLLVKPVNGLILQPQVTVDEHVAHIPHSITSTLKNVSECPYCVTFVLVHLYEILVDFHVNMLLDFTVVCMLLLLVQFGLSKMYWMDLHTYYCLGCSGNVCDVDVSLSVCDIVFFP